MISKFDGACGTITVFAIVMSHSLLLKTVFEKRDEGSWVVKFPSQSYKWALFFLQWATWRISLKKLQVSFFVLEIHKCSLQFATTRFDTKPFRHAHYTYLFHKHLEGGNHYHKALVNASRGMAVPSVCTNKALVFYRVPSSGHFVGIDRWKIIVGIIDVDFSCQHYWI